MTFIRHHGGWLAKGWSVVDFLLDPTVADGSTAAVRQTTRIIDVDGTPLANSYRCGWNHHQWKTSGFHSPGHAHSHTSCISLLQLFLMNYVVPLLAWHRNA